MEQNMGYIVLALLAAPMAVVCFFILAIATGLIHERNATETIAKNYRASWKALARAD
jgi:hypothetical protein